MNHEVAHRSCRQIQLQRLPAFSIVEGNVYASLCTGIQQTLAQGIFADAVQPTALWNSQRNAFPGFAKITSAVQIGIQVFESMAVNSGIRGTRIEMRSFDMGNFAPRTDFRRSKIGPIFTFVPG